MEVGPFAEPGPGGRNPEAGRGAAGLSGFAGLQWDRGRAQG